MGYRLTSCNGGAPDVIGQTLTAPRGRMQHISGSAASPVPSPTPVPGPRLLEAGESGNCNSPPPPGQERVGLGVTGRDGDTISHQVERDNKNRTERVGPNGTELYQTDGSGKGQVWPQGQRWSAD